MLRAIGEPVYMASYSFLGLRRNTVLAVASPQSRQKTPITTNANFRLENLTKLSQAISLGASRERRNYAVPPEISRFSTLHRLAVPARGARHAAPRKLQEIGDPPVVDEASSRNLPVVDEFTMACLLGGSLALVVHIGRILLH